MPKHWRSWRDNSDLARPASGQLICTVGPFPCSSTRNNARPVLVVALLAYCTGCCGAGRLRVAGWGFGLTGIGFRMDFVTGFGIGSIDGCGTGAGFRTGRSARRSDAGPAGASLTGCKGVVIAACFSSMTGVVIGCNGLMTDVTVSISGVFVAAIGGGGNITTAVRFGLFASTVDFVSGSDWGVDCIG
jgi:hypothetical protein